MVMLHCSHTTYGSGFTQWRTKLLDSMEIQAPSYNLYPSHLTQWGSKLVQTVESQGSSQKRHPRSFTQWRSKPLYTMEIQGASHSGGPMPLHRTDTQAVQLQRAPTISGGVDASNSLAPAAPSLTNRGASLSCHPCLMLEEFTPIQCNFRTPLTPQL